MDVRSKEEAVSISIKMEIHPNIESKNIPINEILKENFVAVFCPTNVRSAIVYTYLLLKGFSNIRTLEGGYPALTETLKPGKVLKSQE